MTGAAEVKAYLEGATWVGVTEPSYQVNPQDHGFMDNMLKMYDADEEHEEAYIGGGYASEAMVRIEAHLGSVAVKDELVRLLKVMTGVGLLPIIKVVYKKFQQGKNFYVIMVTIPHDEVN